jgi:hypothetical protein
MASALNWFQIPVTDMARARAFYEMVCDLKLSQAEAGPDMTMCVFPVDPLFGEIGGALVAGQGAVPSERGTIVFLNADPDLQDALDRVEEAGGHVHIDKTPMSDDRGYFAIIADTEGNTVGLCSQQ